MDKTKVSAGKPKISGSIFRAPLGTTLPTDAVSEIGNEFVELGYAGSDGVKNSNSIESGTVQAWGGDVVLMTKTGHTDTFSFTLIESLNPEVLKTVHGDENVSGTLNEGIRVAVNGKEQPPYTWVIDMVLRNAVKRLVIPCGTITEVGEVTYSDSDAIGYAITLSAARDNEGNTHYEYIYGNKQSGV